MVNGAGFQPGSLFCWSELTSYIHVIKLKVMITFEQLKEVLLQGEIEIISDLDNFDDASYMLVAEFNNAKTIHDIVVMYEDRGFETYEAYNLIIQTLMQLVTLD